MQFFLFQIVARVVAIYLAVDCYRKLRRGFAERKIADFNPDILDWFLIGTRVTHRDTAPVSYWIMMTIQATLLLSCVVLAVVGWHAKT